MANLVLLLPYLTDLLDNSSVCPNSFRTDAFQYDFRNVAVSRFRTNNRELMTYGNAELFPCLQRVMIPVPVYRLGFEVSKKDLKSPQAYHCGQYPIMDFRMLSLFRT